MATASFQEWIPFPVLQTSGDDTCTQPASRNKSTPPCAACPPLAHDMALAPLPAPR
jgi:hypothetical protein